MNNLKFGYNPTSFGHGIARIVAIPKKGAWQLMVASNEEKDAADGIFKFRKSENLYASISEQAIQEAATLGKDLSKNKTDRKLIEKYFADLKESSDYFEAKREEEADQATDENPAEESQEEAGSSDE